MTDPVPTAAPRPRPTASRPAPPAGPLGRARRRAARARTRSRCASGTDRLTYRELVGRAAGAGRRAARSAGSGRQSRVGVVRHRRPGPGGRRCWACCSAGGCYVPLEPGGPRRRLRGDRRRRRAVSLVVGDAAEAEFGDAPGVDGDRAARPGSPLGALPGPAPATRRTCCSPPAPPAGPRACSPATATWSSSSPAGRAQRRGRRRAQPRHRLARLRRGRPWTCSSRCCSAARCSCSAPTTAPTRRGCPVRRRARVNWGFITPDRAGRCWTRPSCPTGASVLCGGEARARPSWPPAGRPAAGFSTGTGRPRPPCWRSRGRR